MATYNLDYSTLESAKNALLLNWSFKKNLSKRLTD
jgi:hypothetical protein